MSVTIDDLTPLQKTLLITLTGRALDTGKPRQLLGDRLAADVLDRIGPRGVIKLSDTVTIATSVRSKMLDRIVTRFMAAHPNAVVLELGCGLETRMHRVAVPDTVDWYDIDFAAVIALRRRLIPEFSRAHTVAASLTEPGWLDEIPRDRPVIALADGVLGFLTESDNRFILNSLTEHFTAGGELAFVAYTRIAARLIGSMGVVRQVGIPKGYRGFGFDDPHEPERLNPQLTFIEEQLGAQAPEIAQLPWTTRLLATWFAHWRAQARRGVWVLRYRLGSRSDS
ncbi:class I SAM-dependent methyltransferase [Mycobacteroides abscessus]